MKNNNKQPKKGLGHFLKHHFGYVLLAILCACLAVLLIGYVGQ